MTTVLLFFEGSVLNSKDYYECTKKSINFA